MKFCVQISVALARSSSGGVALRYVLPVLWITSHLAIIGARAGKGWQHSVSAINYVHHQAESDVYECLFEVALESVNFWLTVLLHTAYELVLFVLWQQLVIEMNCTKMQWMLDRENGR